MTDATQIIDGVKIGGEGGVSTFTALTDTPSSYASQAGKVPQVNDGETALEFVNPSAGGLKALQYNWMCL